ncbi:hypothetical protein AAHA92_30891 [Salvia divinorum]|uniref:Myb/SANT-like domain-containing protein n=1 Tax=Salvia divinorum TaxID=28513 RepID=A0ABD1FSC7_SALDI
MLGVVMVIHNNDLYLRDTFLTCLYHLPRLRFNTCLYPVVWGMSSSKRPIGRHNRNNTNEGSNDSIPPKFQKGDRSRRMWSIREEEILVASLLELVARGWKSDNGFRSGYLGKIEDSIRKKFPNSDIKGTPHVVSKISSWKKNYSSLRGILVRSGVGFNVHGDYKIDIDDDQWAQVVQADNNAKFMRNKSWPFWEDWKCIFGKDRATGGGAEPVEKATAEVRAQLAGGSQCNQKDYHPSFEDFLGDELPNLTPESEHQNSSSGHNDQPESTTKSGTLKRKLNPSDTSLMEFLGNLHAETNSRLDVISSRIGYEFDLGKARQEVFDKLGGVDELTLDQRYDLCDILGDKPQRLEVFMGMPANARLGYVLRLIQHNHGTI